MQGTVSVEVVIGTDGAVKQVEIIEPRGAGLDDAAVEAVRQWKYTPTLLNGKPVEVISMIDVIYRLEWR